ncbi:MAG: hypothetical protein IKJ80_08315 [Clostridia bacterium]|nr:hypothetical protein [Clostridia bacterium]
MKKILSVVIAISMLLGMMIPMGITTSAAEATECATWAEVVAAVEADNTASIKLTNHVTANSTIASFAGTFDGNGYTVTVENTMFAEVTGTATLKNFQTAAAAAITVAPIVNLLKGDATVVIENVVNNVDVAESTEQMGGIIAKTSGTVSLTMTSCVNNGDLQTVNQASGIVGNADGTLTVNFTDVVNNGNITGNQNYAAGILCTNGGVEGTMTRVVNNGNIVIESKKANNKGSNGAGIIGTAKGKAVVTLTECVNTGDVTLITENTSAHYGVSAFATRTDNESSVFTLNGCVSTGVMTSATAGTTADAIALPAKKGAASATNTSYVDGETTIAGATKVDAATAEASIAAIEAKMTLPTFDANKAPETTTPGGEGESDTFKQVVDVDFATATIEGPSVLTVGETGVMTITFEGDVWQIGIGLTSSDKSVADFTGTASAVFTPDHAHIFATPASETAYSFQANSSIADTYSKIVVSFNITATAAGTTTIEWIPGEEDQLYICSQNGTEHYHEELLGYNLTVVAAEGGEGGEGGDESTPVDLFNVNGYVAPTVGANIIDPMTSLSVPTDAPYSIVDAYWYNDSLGVAATEETFLAGNSYSLRVEIQLADGYVFADEYTVQLNGDASLVDVGECYVDNDGDLVLWSVITDLPAEGGDDESTVIDIIGINGFAEPTEGASVAENIAALQAAGEGYTISAAWYTFGDEPAGDTFGAGSYFLRVAITANEGYVIADNAAFTINDGDKDDVIDTSSSTVYEGGASALLDTVYITVEGEGGETTEEIEIDSVDVSGITAPTHGQTVADYKASLTLVLPDGANYSVFSITITEINPETMGVIAVLEDGGIFDSSKTYAVGIVVKADEGYTFATDAVLTANGGEYEPIRTMIEGDEAGVAVAFTPAEGGEGGDETTPVDLINVNGYVAPTVGADIIDPMTFLSVPEGAPYSIIDAYWYNDSPLDTIPTEETFLAGYSYSLGVVIRLADGYVFADEYTVQLNGDASLVDVEATYEENATDLVIWSVITELPAEGGEGGDTTPDGSEENPFVITNKDDVDAIDVPAGETYYFIIDPWNVPETSLEDFIGNLIKVIGEGATINGGETLDLPTNGRMGWPVLFSITAGANENAGAEIVVPKGTFNNPDTFDENGEAEIDLTSPKNDFEPYIFLFTADESGLLTVTAPEGAVVTINNLTTYQYGDSGVNTAFVKRGDEIQVIVATEGADAKGKVSISIDPIIIDAVDVSGITAPENGQTVADYAASFVPELPADAKYSILNISWFELDPETLGTDADFLPDDYVFDSTKTYGFQLLVKADEGYAFAIDAVITANGGTTELHDSITGGDTAALAIVFKPAPSTGDNSAIAIFAIAAVATIGCVAFALRKKKED